MDSQMEWTLETYRLDELERKFAFPCVVCVNEGYYSETDAEGFSQGDIMSIDSKIILHKVAANFTLEEKNTKWDDPDYVEVENEILVPLNYKGKLKVIRHIKDCENVRELANEFPKYAKVIENLTVRTEEKVPVTIQAGSIIELDRVIPGSVRGTNKDPDRLVIQFEHKSGALVVGVPFDVQGKFRTEPDNNEYTIREAIDRYSLPQHVKFVDDEIKRIYTQDLIEGIENMKTITVSETLRLNRLVTQNVLVGHYKPLEETETKETGRFRQRTLVVLPVDNPEIRDIEVNVLKGVTDDIYEQVFLVRNVSNNCSGDIVDGSLYVDFAMTSGIKIISHEDSQLDDEEKAPPRPPKPGFLSASAASKKPPKKAPKPKWNSKHSKKPQEKTTEPGLDVKHSKMPEEKGLDTDDTYIIPEVESKLSLERKKKEHKLVIKQKSPSQDRVSVTSVENTGDYEEPESPISRPTTDEYVGFSLADMNFGSIGSGGKGSLRKKSLMSNIKSSLQKGFKGAKGIASKGKTSKEKTDPSIATELSKTARPVSTMVDDDDEEPGLYSEVDETLMIDVTPPKPRKHLKGVQKQQKPTAFVHPSTMSPTIRQKQFKDLDNNELVSRLIICGLTDFADFCKNEKLNGSFFQNMSAETLQKNVNLKGIQLAKFIQMRDENWIPS